MDLKSIKKISHSPEQTMEIGKWLVQYLHPGSIVALCGEFGAGKTVLVKGIAKALGVDDVIHTVISPSFTLVKEYEGTYPIFHFDLYRIQSEEDLFTIGYEEYLTRNGLIVVEWADKFLHLFPQKILKVSLSVTGVNERQLVIEGIKNK